MHVTCKAFKTKIYKFTGEEFLLESKMLPYLQAVTLKTYSEPFSLIDKYSGSFSNDNCDGNENVKNEKGLGLVYMKKKSSRERGSSSQPSQL